MKNLSFDLSNEAYEILKKTAEIQEITIQEYINKEFRWCEFNKNKPEMLEQHYERIRESHLRKKAEAMYRKHLLQEYILDYFPDTKITKKTIAWRTCPIQPEARFHSKEKEEHVGEYWYTIRKYKKASLAGIFREVDTTKTFYFKSLKALKRNINKVFGYDHYKIKKRR